MARGVECRAPRHCQAAPRAPPGPRHHQSRRQPPTPSTPKPNNLWIADRHARPSSIAARRAPCAPGRWWHGNGPLCPRPGDRRQSRALECRACRSGARRASRVHRRRLRHRPHQQLRRQRLPAEAARRRRPGRRAERGRGNSRPSCSGRGREAGDRRRLDRAHGRDPGAGRNAAGGRRRGGVSCPGRGPGRRRRRCALDRDHVVGRGAGRLRSRPPAAPACRSAPR